VAPIRKGVRWTPAQPQSVAAYGCTPLHLIRRGVRMYALVRPRFVGAYGCTPSGDAGEGCRASRREYSTPPRLRATAVLHSLRKSVKPATKR
jgi:hypothetical protein